MTTSDSTTIKNHAAFIWSVADLLRGDYKQSDYGKVILPLTVLRRLDCVLETSVLKTIAAFLNGAEGGTLLIGVADDGTVHGLDSDYATLRKEGRGDRDVFQLHLANIIGASMGDAAGTAVSAQFHSVDGHDLCRVHVRPSAVPVEAKVSVEKNGQIKKTTVFYVRRLNGRGRCRTPSARTTSSGGGRRRGVRRMSPVMVENGHTRMRTVTPRRQFTRGGVT